MKLINNKDGVVEIESITLTQSGKIQITYLTKDGLRAMYTTDKIGSLTADFKDYEELKKYRYVLPNKVRRAILSWVKAQDNPIEKISILLKSYYDTNEVDSDGFYDYEFYGYVGDNNKNLVANTLSIRLKKPFYYEENKDYTLLELGIIGVFGGEK